MPAITHAAWRTDMNAAIEIVRLIGQRLDARIAALEDRDAGPEHLALVRQRYASVVDSAGIGDQIVEAADDVHVPVGEAIAAGGGRDWIAGDKEFLADD